MYKSPEVQTEELIEKVRPERGFCHEFGIRDYIYLEDLLHFVYFFLLHYSVITSFYPTYFSYNFTLSTLS